PYIDQNLDYTAKNLCDDIQAGDISGISLDSTFALSQTGFALDLFQHEYKNGTNTLISPYSVMQALAMTANGADGQTKTDMEKVLGGIPVETLDAYLYTQRISQPDSERCKLKTANSIWVKNDGTIKVKPDFLQTVKDNFDSAVFEAAFDNTTVDDINKWVNINTDEMIPSLLKDIPEAAVMYLINAVSFDAEWQTQYDSTYNVGKGTFTAYDGTKQSCDMMHSREYDFISDDNSIGFMKDYSGGRYAFAAILPNENISIDDYIAGLTPESLHEMFGNSKYKKISASLPKFSYDYNSTLSKSLKDMGMESAFDARLADFSKMGETVTGMLFINDVKHKTHIDVNESGTKAAAVTSVEMNAGDSADPPIEITLNRPFVYCIVDTEVDVPIFIGTLNSID
ncbi:MAG: serpin family protein, partial [Ruminococcus sp.]|nr:serpin family protein [Ruminococcus sp.]